MMQLQPDDPEADWTAPGVYDVGAGVYRIPLPLPQDGLRAVNVYAVRAGDGLTLVDSGWAITEARELLEQAVKLLDCSLAGVRRFLVTHVHRDHYTLAVTLRREFGMRVSLGEGEAGTLQAIRDKGSAPWGTMMSQLQLGGALDLIQQAKDDGQVRAFTGNEYLTSLESGDFVACMAWSGDIVQLQQTKLQQRVVAQVVGEPFGSAERSDRIAADIGDQREYSALRAGRQLLDILDSLRLRRPSGVGDRAVEPEPVGGIEDIGRDPLRRPGRSTSIDLD